MPRRQFAVLHELGLGTTQKISLVQQVRQLIEGQETRRARRCQPTFDPQKKTISVAAIGVPSVEVAIEKLVQAVSSIVRCLAVVFQPVPQHGLAGLEVRVIETVVRAGIHYKLDWRPVVTPGGDFVGTVCRRCPIVERPDKDERGYPRTRRCLLTWRVERSRRPEPQVAGRDEQLERIWLCDREGHPCACREADGSHALWIDERLASQEDKSPVGIPRSLNDGGKRA